MLQQSIRHLPPGDASGGGTCREDTNKGGLEIKNRSYHLRSFYSCFVASELVDWMVQNGEAASREEGVELGQLLVRADFIHHVVDEHHFEDNFLFFRFRQDEPPVDLSGPTMTCIRGQEGSLIGQLYRKRFFGYSDYTFAFSPSNCHLYQFRNELVMTSMYGYDLNGATVRPEAKVQANRYFLHISMADKRVLALSAEDSETQLRWLKVFADNDIEILPSEEDEDELVKKALSAYDFVAKDIDGETINLSKYTGHVCLVVNVASQ